MTGRVEGRELYIAPNVYADRKEDYRIRIEEMLKYASSNNQCRSRLLLEYFGEKDVEDCGQCDVCRRRRKKKAESASPSVRKQISDMLRDGEWHSVKELNKLNVNRDKIDTALREMIEEEELEMDAGMISLSC